MDRAAYVARVLHLYLTLPGALHRVLRDDRRTASELHRRGIPIAVVEDAFILTTARRAVGPKDQPLDPIRVLRYILPVIEELLSAPPAPEYIRYLEARVRQQCRFYSRLITMANRPSHIAALVTPPARVAESGNPLPAPRGIAREASSGIA